MQIQFSLKKSAYFSMRNSHAKSTHYAFQLKTLKGKHLLRNCIGETVYEYIPGLAWICCL